MGCFKFNMLPQDIMLEIFSRVPTESVIDCILVSKPWRKLLQYPSLYQMHMNHLDSGKLSFIFCTLLDDTPYYHIEYDENLNCFSRTIRIIKLGHPIRNYIIQASCNGLICIDGYIDGCYVRPAYICNPITREYIVLPKSEGKPLLIGFGYIPSRNKYKVVRIREDLGNLNCGILQVYTLGSDMGWRDVWKVDYRVTYYRQRGLFADGAIHWKRTNGSIVAFDLADEEFRQLPSLPHSRCSIAELGEFLCVYYRHDAGGFDIWVLKKNKSNHVIWSKEFSSNLNMMVKPIYFTTKNGLLCYDEQDKNFYRYPSKASSSRMLVNFGKTLSDVVPHKNTLVSLKALGEEDAKLMDASGRERSSGEQESHAVISPRNRRKKKNSR